MNRDEILGLAREAGVMPLEHFYVTDVFLQRFVHLVEQRMIRDGYRKCAEGQRTTQFCGLLDAAVKAEREACAKVCEELRDEDGNVSFCIAGAVMTSEDIIQLALEHFGAVLKPSDLFEPYGTECAAAIRARGET